jgi:hypothetical protein
MDPLGDIKEDSETLTRLVNQLLADQQRYAEEHNARLWALVAQAKAALKEAS